MRGFETLGEIEKAIAQVRERERAIADDLEVANQTHTELMGERAQLLRKLAAARAKNAVADGVIDRADRLQGEVAMLLASRQDAVDRLKTEITELSARHTALQAESAAKIDEIADLENEIDAAAERARASLTGTPRYDAAVTRRDTLAAQIGKAEAKSRQAAVDRVEKGKPFQADPLFMYLWRRKYGTRDYEASFLIRWLDGWVARLVRYNGARANYAMLNEIPKRLSAHVAALKEQLAQSRLAVSDMEADKIRELAGPGLADRLGAKRAELSQIDNRIASCAAQRNEAQNALNRYAEGLDDGFRLAVDTLSGFLERSKYNGLMRLVRETPDASDDQLVARIGNLNRQTSDLSAKIRDKRDQIEKLAARRDELLRVAADLRRKSFHQPGSVFDTDYDMNDLLRDVVRGGLTVAEYWARTQRRQRWRGRPGDSYRRSAGFPPFELPDFDELWDDDIWDDDDDFRTGGGF